MTQSWLHLLLAVVTITATSSSLLLCGAAAAVESSTTSTTAARGNAKYIANNDDDGHDDDCMVCHITKVQAMFQDENDNDNIRMYSCATTTATQQQPQQQQQQPQNHQYWELVLNQANEIAHGQAIQAGNFYACIPNAYIVIQQAQQRQQSDTSTTSSSRSIVLPDDAPLLHGFTTTTTTTTVIMDKQRQQRRELQQQQPQEHSSQQSQQSPSSSSWNNDAATTPTPPTTRQEMVQLRTGVKKMLVVRLVTTRGEEPEESIDEIQGAIFGTGPLALNSTSSTTTTINNNISTIVIPGAAASVVEQYQAASLGALKYEPLTGAAFPHGVLQVTVDLQMALSGIQTITSAILNATAVALGLPMKKMVSSSSSNANNDEMVNLPPSSLVQEEQEVIMTRVHEVAHHTIFCLPPGSLLGGSPEWTAFTYLYEPYSYYQRGRCTALSVVMHEIGHSLGFRHSGGSAAAAGTSSSTTRSASDNNNNNNNTVQEEEEEDNENNPYSDETGYMGYSIFQKGMPRKGFNAHKNWISGWFPQERLVSVNATALMLQSPPPAAASYDDGDDAATDPLIVLQSTETENATVLPITTITTGDATTTGGGQAVNRLSPVLPREEPAVAVGRLVAFVDGTKMLESNDALLLQIETPRSRSSIPDDDNSTTMNTNDDNYFNAAATASSPQYFYLQYNRVKGFNQDSAHPDTVTVVQADHEMQVSYLKAALSTRQAYRVDIIDDSNSSSNTASMVVTVCSLGSNVMDDVDTLDYARVAVHVERSLPQSSSSTSSFDPCRTSDNAFGQHPPSSSTTTTNTEAGPTPAPNVAMMTPKPTSPPAGPSISVGDGPQQQQHAPPMDDEADNNGGGSDQQPRNFFPDPSLPSSSVQSDNGGNDEKSISEQLFSVDTTVGRLSIIISVMICLVIVITVALIWACRRHVCNENKLELERQAAQTAATTCDAVVAVALPTSPPRNSSSSSPHNNNNKKELSSAIITTKIVDLQIVEDPTDSTAEEDLTDASDDPLCLSERGSSSTISNSIIIASPPPRPTPPHRHRRGSGGSKSRRPLTPQERRRVQQLRQQQQHYHHIQSQLPQHSPYHHHRIHHSSSRRSRHSSPSSSSSSRVSPALSCSPPAFVDDLSMIEEDPLSISESSRSSGSSNDNSGSGADLLLLEDLTDSSLSDDPLVLSSTSSGRFGVI